MPPLTTHQIERAKTIDLLALIGNDVELCQISSHELSGPCPFCGGKDRFHVQPEQGRWFCRQCTGDPAEAGWQDAIDYVRRRQGLGFRQAVAWLTNRFPQRRQPGRPKPSSTTSAWLHPAWQKQAWSEVRQAQQALAAAAGERGRSYLLDRGLAPSVWEAWGLGYGQPWHPERGAPQPAILLPWQSGRRLCAVQYRFITNGLTSHERFSQRRGGERLLFGLPLLAGRSILFLVEGELNALSLWQVCRERADVLSWGPQGNLLRPPVIALAVEIARRYQRLVLWADDLALAVRGQSALVSAGLRLSQACILWSAEGMDANDLLQRGDLLAFISPLCG